MPLNEYYIVVDIESSGPSPDRYALLSLGAATLERPSKTFYIEFQPDSDEYTEEALSISGLSIPQLSNTGIPPEDALRKFAQWVNTITPHGQIPIFTAFNAPFDWMFVNTYFHKYLGYNPFGHKALDIKALFMGAHHTPFLHTSHFQICEHYGLTSTLSHHALEDAVQEAQLLERILAEIERLR